MSSFNHILAATDLSAPARHAAERAALVSQATDASLDLLHVANFAPLERLRLLMEAAPIEMEKQVLATALQRLQELAAGLGQRYDVTAGTYAVAGSLLEVLGRQCAVLATDLLVCGAKGESILRRLLLGTTAQRILNATKCPVLVVKQAPHESYKRLLVPVDFSPSSLRAIRHARNIAPQADIVLLHAYEVPFEGRMRYANVDDDIIKHYRIVSRQETSHKLDVLCDEAGLLPSKCGQVVLQGDPRMRILEQEQELDCDLIVMGKHGKTLLEELLVGSVTEHILTESQSDVFVSV
jgi:universal stress protein E